MDFGFVTSVKLWSNFGQTSVKLWSNFIQLRSKIQNWPKFWAKFDQIRPKFWLNFGFIQLHNASVTKPKSIFGLRPCLVPTPCSQLQWAIKNYVQNLRLILLAFGSKNGRTIISYVIITQLKILTLCFSRKKYPPKNWIACQMSKNLCLIENIIKALMRHFCMQNLINMDKGYLL